MNLSRIDVYYFKIELDHDQAETEEGRLSVICRKALLHLAAQRWDLDVSNLKIVKAKNGKPYFERYPDCFFNISYSRPYCMFALAEIPIGVDVEKKRSINPYIMKRIFTCSESQYVLNDINKYYEIWTKKEAYVKHSGQGIKQLFSYPKVDVLNDKVENNFKTHSFNQSVMSIYYENIDCEVCWNEYPL